MTLKPARAPSRNKLRGELLKDLRLKQELTQQQVADQIGVCRQAISRLEGGKRRLDGDEAESLSILFNVSVECLLAGRLLDRALPTFLCHPS